MSDTIRAVLRKYGLSPDDLLHKVMEAEVYVLGAEMMLKLYIATVARCADVSNPSDAHEKTNG